MSMVKQCITYNRIVKHGKNIKISECIVLHALFLLLLLCIKLYLKKICMLFCHWDRLITSARRLCNHLGLYVCMCVYVCLSVNTITQKIINIWTSNFAHTFAIA